MTDVTQIAEGKDLESALSNAKMLAAFYSRKREETLYLSGHTVLELGERPGNNPYVRVEAKFKY